jgi:hypothetical protein
MQLSSKQKPKKGQNEAIEGALGDVYAVQKPYSDCKMNSLVTPFNPMMGIPMDQMPHDQVYGVFPDKDQAMSIAEKLYKEHLMYEQALEEKKVKVTEKLKSTMSKLERARSQSMGIIKENPKEAINEKQKVAHLTQKIDELMMKLERIEMSKKQLKQQSDKNKDKK